MGSDALDTEYENGVADVLSFLAGGEAIVERNVHLLGAKSRQDRQIDVLVTGHIFGTGNATMVVDCKRYKKPVDVNTVGAFVALIEDVGADIGLLVTTTGASDAAREYADNTRGIRLDILPLDTLTAWSPKGTVFFDYAVPSHLYAESNRSLRRAGFRVKPTAIDKSRSLNDYLGLSAYRHLGSGSPSGEIQVQARNHLLAALAKVGVTEPIGLGNGVVTSGGTPSDRWLDVSLSGQKAGLKILAASENDITAELDRLADILNLPRQLIDVIRPTPWPIPTIFPSWR